MANLCPILWMVLATITIAVGRVPEFESDDVAFFTPDRNGFPSTNFVPEKIKIVNGVYDNLLNELSQELAAENIAVVDYFPKDVESDERDELELVQEYDLDEDDDLDGFENNLPDDASLSTGFGERQFKFAKVLTVSKNGTKIFTKFRQSVRAGGTATSTETGNYNTSLDVSTSSSGKFDVNVTIVSNGKEQKVTARGTANASASSKSKIKNRRLFQRASSDSTITLQIPSVVHIDSKVRTGSETLRLPFKSFLTLFSARINTTVSGSLKMKSIAAGEVISRIAFANKTVSLTKSCVKAYVKARSIGNNSTVDDDSITDEQFYDPAHNGENDAVASSSIFQIALIRAKTHTWTKVVSQSKSEVVIDVITCKKIKNYGKIVKKGDFVTFAGSGEVSWEKSRVTINAQRLQNLSPREYGVQFIKKQAESGSLIPILQNTFEM